MRKQRGWETTLVVSHPLSETRHHALLVRPRRRRESAEHGLAVKAMSGLGIRRYEN